MPLSELLCHSAPEEFHGEEGVEKEVTQEIIEPTRISTPEQPEQNNEGAPQEENQGICQDNSPGPSKQTVVPSKKTKEIKRLRKEQQRLLNVIAQLRQKIRVLKMRKRVKRTSEVRHATTSARPLKKKVRRTQVQLVVQNQKEHSAVIHVEVQTNDMSACDKEVQIEAQPSKELRTMNTRQCNKKIQVNLPLTTTMWDSDPRTGTLQEVLVQAQQAVEKLTEQTVSREKYE